MDSIMEKIEQKRVQVGIIGLGYVGLPLALEFTKIGFKVTGIDLDKKKIEAIYNGKSYIKDSTDAEIKNAVEAGLLKATTDFSVLKELDTVSICVPTPLRKTKDPDISYIISATEQIRRYLHRGQLIVLESTTYPGTTEEIIQPELEATGLKAGVDFFLAFSPERIDPGNPFFNTKNTPKIIGVVTDKCTEVACALYKVAVDSIVPVSSTRAAEMVKLLENTFRAVNIGLVNEIAIICNKLGMDVWEIIDAAATKPFGFMPFYPGPGLGGHCIPIDPHYLSWKLKLLAYKARLIEMADEINREMPRFVVEKVVEALNREHKSVKGSKILILGVAYKKDSDDVRESPALDIMQLLHEKGGKICYNDPLVSQMVFDNQLLCSVPLNGQSLSSFDVVVVVTDHTRFDARGIVEFSRLVIDTRNLTRGIQSEKVV